MIKNSEIERIENKKNKQDVYVIRWRMTTLCNYQCDFCIQGDRNQHIENSKGESAEVRRQICNGIISFIENELNGKYKSLRIFLIGGEVTILKDFREHLQRLASVKFDGDIRFHITTNLSLNKEELLNITKIFKGNLYKDYMRILNISASFYKKYATEEEFMDKIKFIYNSHKRVNHFIMSKETYLKNSKFKNTKLMFIKILGKMNRNIELSMSYPLVEDKDYVEFQEFKKRNLKYFNNIGYIIIRNYHKEIGSELKRNLKREGTKNIQLTTTDKETFYFRRNEDVNLFVEGGFNPKGMLCSSGVNSILIENTGVVSRCPSCVKASVIGNILDSDFKPIEEWFTCPSKSCMCNYYSVIKKA